MKLYFSYLKMMLCIAVTALFSVGCNENTNDFPPLEGNIMITQATEQIQTAPQNSFRVYHTFYNLAGLEYHALHGKRRSNR